MDIYLIIIAAAATALIVLVIGYFVLRSITNSKAKAILDEAALQAEVIKKNKLIEAKEEELKIKSEAEKQANARLAKAQQAEARNKQKENQLSQLQGELQRKKNELETLKLNLDNQASVLDSRKQELDRRERDIQETLEHVSGLSAEEAKEKLIESLKDEAKTAAASYINDIMDDAKLTANKEAKRIVVQSIQRVATETAIENAVTVFHIDSDEIKGRIIGREGRNIRAL